MTEPSTESAEKPGYVLEAEARLLELREDIWRFVRDHDLSDVIETALVTNDDEMMWTYLLGTYNHLDRDRIASFKFKYGLLCEMLTKKHVEKFYTLNQLTKLRDQMVVYAPR